MESAEQLSVSRAMAIAGHFPVLAGAMPVVALLLTGAAHDEYAKAGATGGFWFLGLLVLLLALLATWDLVNVAHDVKFLRWLYRNRESLRRSVALLDATPISAETQLFRYRAYFGLLVFGFARQSRYRVEPSSFDRVTSTLVALVGGWWAVPWGPVRTLNALRDNAKGPVVYAVRELLDAMEQKPALATPPRR